MADFAATIAQAYAAEGATVDLGRGVLDGKVVPEAAVKVPLRMMNRHGLIAGATGTGKTKTLQGLAEQLSAAGVPVFAADVKGDVSGLAVAGEPGGPAEKRMQELGLPFAPASFPVEFLSLGGIGPGVPVRATVSDFGSQLLAKVLQSNETQEQSLGLVFHYADEKGLPLLDLSDLRALLTFLDSDAGQAELKGIGGLSSQTVGVLLRSLVGLEDGGGNEFFGEPQLDIADLMRTAPDGRGIISCLELPAVQDKPALFSTVLMWLLAELFEELPEAGDLEKPKLVFFFDEAHLLFDGASKAFVDSVQQTVRLIRSKGIGVFFVTQTPKDLPADVLGQLGNRVQHALRAFTPDDAKALKATVSTFPKSDFYDLGELLTQMGIGEAAVTVLSEDGVPTPVVHTRMLAPASRMAPADDVDGPAKASPLWAKYGTRVDSESAREKLAARMEAPAPAEAPEPEPEPEPKHKEAADAAGGGAGAIGDFLSSRQGKALEREVVRGVFGMLKRKLLSSAADQLGKAGGGAAATRRVIPPFTEEMEEFRLAVRRFVINELAPKAQEYEDAHWFPNEVFERLAELGYIGLKFEEEYGGQGGGYLAEAVFCEELSHCGSGGLAAGLGAHSNIAMPPIWKFGTEDQKQRYLVPGIKAEKIGALGITEPDAGSDVAGIKTFAKRVDGGYLVNGSKMFITNGVRADFIVTAVKTTQEGGHHGLSFLIVDRGEGVHSTAIEKLGWHASDTALIALDDVFVPEENLLGEENQGFYLIMANFQWERLMMALGSIGGMQRCFDRTLEYAKERKAFGHPIGSHQAIRHKFAAMATTIEAGRSLTYHGLRLFLEGRDAVREVTMAKLATQRAAFDLADTCLQIHGGAGYMKEYGIERAVRDARLGPIGGGTDEVMKEILGKSYGL